MIKADLHNIKGEKTGTINLPKDIFGVEANSDLIYQVVRAQTLNRRQNSAHSKDRSDVSGGGKKPWRQKGTGRARHGSNRSPIWKGGGVTFGPRNERNYKKKINKKAKRKALFMVLSAKVEKDLIFFVSDLNFKEPKTKEMRQFLSKTFCEKSTLLVLPDMNKNVILSTRNIENVDVIQAKDINSLDLLSYKYLIVPEEAVTVIKESFVSTKEGEEIELKKEKELPKTEKIKAAVVNNKIKK
jgi:large subunit ribosomal protein L4